MSNLFILYERNNVLFPSVVVSLKSAFESTPDDNVAVTLTHPQLLSKDGKWTVPQPPPEYDEHQDNNHDHFYSYKITMPTAKLKTAVRCPVRSFPRTPHTPARLMAPAASPLSQPTPMATPISGKAEWQPPK